MGAPLKNTNKADNKRWKMAIESALALKGTDKWQALTAIAAKLIERAEEGDMSALKELGDRIDGKASQQVAITDSEGGPLQVVIKAYALNNPE